MSTIELESDYTFQTSGMQDVELSRKTSFLDSLYILKKPEGKIISSILPSIRRIANIYGEKEYNVYSAQHRKDIQFDAISFLGYPISEDDVFAGMAALQELTSAYYETSRITPLGYENNQAMREDYKESVDAVIWHLWKPEGTTPEEMATSLHEYALKRLHKPEYRNPFYDKELSFQQFVPDDESDMKEESWMLADQEIQFENVINREHFIDSLVGLDTLESSILYSIAIEGHSINDLIDMGIDENSIKNTLEIAKSKINFDEDTLKKSPNKIHLNSPGVSFNILHHAMEIINLPQLVYFIQQLKPDYQRAVLYEIGYFQSDQTNTKYFKKQGISNRKHYSDFYKAVTTISIFAKPQMLSGKEYPSQTIQDIVKNLVVEETEIKPLPKITPDIENLRISLETALIHKGFEFKANQREIALTVLSMLDRGESLIAPNFRGLEGIRYADIANLTGGAPSYIYHFLHNLPKKLKTMLAED